MNTNKDLDIFLRNGLKNEANCEPSLRNFFLSDRPAIIYGAGNQAQIIWLLCLMFGKKIMYLLTSGSKARNPGLPSADLLPLMTLDEFSENPDSYDVIIAVNEKFNEEICSLLADKKIHRVFFAQNWFEQNALLMDIFVQRYAAYYGGKMCNHPVTGRRFLMIPMDYGDLKLDYPLDIDAYKRNLMAQFLTLMIGELFGDFRCNVEYPYEFPPNVKLSSGDIVLDCGANIGSFTNIAASHGCTVYAFEPAPRCLPYLKYNADLYPHLIHIMPFALGCTIDTIPFYVNNDLEHDFSLDKGNQFNPLAKNYEEIKIKTTTIDDFVQANNVKHIDFIKADIEGAERLLIQGGQHTLRKYGPKLALCSYHLPDDPHELERLIIMANPNYVIIHQKCPYSKIFAYVPS